jgi:L-ascorbate metabolism protein UlaG (beta-lactamase superfamily)
VHITFLGHATVRIELDDARLLTDPVLRPYLAGLVHRQPLQNVERMVEDIDAVLISHLHHDHLDLPSLKLLPAEVTLLVPRRGGKLVKHVGASCVREVTAGETVDVRGVRVRATPARHDGFRGPFGPLGDTLGFLIEGSRRIYFAGDTDVFPEMAELGPVDVALLPVAGWGPRLGPGHMGPGEAVRALELLRARVAVPIHWGTLVPVGLHFWTWPYLTRPPVRFADLARRSLPQVEVHILKPGQTLAL